MEDLINNFCRHIKDNISNTLGQKLEYYIQNMLQNDSDYDEMEHEIKSIIMNYLKCCDKDNFYKISNNLYNAYVEKDDNDIVNVIKFMIRIYTKFQEIKLKKLFYRWRINSLYKNMNNKPIKNIQVKRIEKDYSTIKITNSESVNKIKTNEIKNENIPMSIENYNKRKNKENKISVAKQNNNVFSKLYMDAFIKQDEKILNDEIRRLAELGECTFQPNKKKNL